MPGVPPLKSADVETTSTPTCWSWVDWPPLVNF